MRQSWTDDRLDGVNELIKDVGSRMGQLEERMNRLDERRFLQLGIATIVTFVVGFAGVTATLIVALLL